MSRVLPLRAEYLLFLLLHTTVFSTNKMSIRMIKLIILWLINTIGVGSEPQPVIELEQTDFTIELVFFEGSAFILWKAGSNF